ncbi:dopaminechrome tautomerase-like [Lycorma delicatula]|uniref:dopaminechrome tautomerase-like n=1 Tax=Lycorma delicatula TaxID=130591 RepID=UPI003F51091B
MNLLLSLCFSFLICINIINEIKCVSVEEFRVVYEWYKLDFTWKDDNAKLDAFINRRYIPENNIISGIKVWKNHVFLTLPRWKEGVPATVATVPSIPRGPSASPRLEPFPSWDWQDVNNCSCLRNVHATEIDPEGILWIIDTGTVNELTIPNRICPPKLILFNIDKKEHILTYIFPDDVVNRDSVLFDIVVDPKTKTAFISDSSEYEPGIIVYRDGKSYKVTGGIAMHSDPSLGSFIVNGTEVNLHQNIGGLALSIPDQVLYFSPVTSYHLYSVHLSVIDEPGDVSTSIRDLGRKASPTSSMILDSKHVLYFGLLERDAIAKWNSSKDPFPTGQHIITEDKSLLQWPSSFGFDSQGSLWVISNRFQTYLENRINLEVPNFRLIKAYTGTNSYLYSNGYTQQPHENTSSTTYINNSLLITLNTVLLFFHKKLI